MTAQPHLPNFAPILALAAGLAACNQPAPTAEPGPQPSAQAPAVTVETGDEPKAPPPASQATPPPPSTPPSPPATPPKASPEATAPAWSVSRLGDGATATVSDARGVLLRITCTGGPGRLSVDAPRVRHIGSEERLSLGFGNNPIALVARSAGPGNGVTASGALPANIAGRILRAGTVQASYGAQVVGPFDPPRGEDAMTLANACAQAASPMPPRPAPGDNRPAQIPVNFRGEWNARLQDCGTGRNDSRLVINARTIRFYESRAEVTEVTRQGPRAISVEARYRGEGETWTRATRMILSRSGDELTIEGATRLRCPTGADADGRPGRRAEP